MKGQMIGLSLCVAAMCATPVRSAEVDIIVRGTLRAPPPCTISDGGVITTDFGERVGINRVDGVNYRQKVDYRIRCEPAGALPWEVVLTVKGRATAFDSAAVQTNKADLGIRFYQNEKPFPLNRALKIDPANPPRLEVAPVARPGGALTEGAFAATATLQADYQ